MRRALLAVAVAAALWPAAFSGIASAADNAADGVKDSFAAPGSESFYRGKAEGWFWYKDPPEEEPELEVKAPTPPPPPPAPIQKAEPPAAPPAPPGPELFSVAWIRDNLPKYRDRAIDNPTDANVQAYYYLQRVMMDKSSKFSERSSQVIMRDPFLDEDSRRPVATYAANALNREVSNNRDKVLKGLANKVGLFFFFKGNCVLCAEQAAVLQSLTAATGIRIIPVSLDGAPLDNGLFANYRTDDGQAKKLEVYQAPALALAIPPGRTEIVGYGAITLDVLFNRVLIAAREASLIDQKTFASTQPFFDNGLLTLEDNDGLSQDQIDQDPAAFVESMRRKLARKTIDGEVPHEAQQ
nr:conjugal transfer protein TraF [uncultured Pseudomonas sp.]